MPRLRPVLLAILLIGCGEATAPRSIVVSGATGEAVLPDTATVDGVLTYSHDATALTRASQFTVDAKALVVYDGGTNTNFDLTDVRRPLLFPDGRLLAAKSLGNGWLMLFKSNGSPDRILAPSGEGPGDVRSPADPILLSTDSALVVDGSLHRVNWLTADKGIVRSEPLQNTVMPFCFQGAALVVGPRLLALDGCAHQEVIDRLSRPPAVVVTMQLNFGSVDTVSTLRGYEQIPFETHYRGVKRVYPMPLRLGRFPQVVPWEGGFVTATGENGYVLQRHSLDGTLVSRITLAVPRRAVTEAMRQEEIRRELERYSEAQMERMVDPEETKRQARVRPFADSLPPYEALFPAPDNLLWVVDFATWVDSTWSATAFRPDGAIVGRITVPVKQGVPVSFGRDRVLLRMVDDDDVVRFGLYRIIRSQ